MEGEIQRNGSFFGSPLPFWCLLAAAEGALGTAPRGTRRAVEPAPGQGPRLPQRSEKVGGYPVLRKAAAAAAGERRGGSPQGSSGALIGVTLAEEVFSPHMEQGWPILRLLGLRRLLEEIQGLGERWGMPGTWDRPPDEEGPAWRAGQESHEQDAHGHEQRQSHVRGARRRKEKERVGQSLAQLGGALEVVEGVFLQDTHRRGSGARSGAVRSAEAPELGLLELE